MNAAEKFFKIVDKIAYVLSASCIAGMLICVFLQVLAREFQFSVNWTTELSQYFFLWSTTFGGYVIARRNKMIGVVLIQNMMPSPLRRLMKFASWTAGAAFYFIVIYYCIPRLPRLMVQTTPILKWSMGLMYIIMMVGLGMMSLYFVYLAFKSLFESEKKPQTQKTAEQIAEEVE